MNLDELRTALREPAPVPLSISIDRVVARGRRRRAVRRAAVPMAVVATTAAVAVPVTLIGGDTPAFAPAPTATPTATPSRRPLPPASVTTPWGDVVRTGEPVQGAERIFWFWRLPAGDAPPDVTFGVAGGHLTTDGDRVLDTATNDPDGAGASPGFHAGILDRFTGPRQDVWLLYGYYVGPVHEVALRLGGKDVRARTARWSEDPSVTLYWVAAGPGVPQPGDAPILLTAYDAAGGRLPEGDATVLTPPRPAVPRR
jgi:hypothetical protein